MANPVRVSHPDATTVVARSPDGGPGAAEATALLADDIWSLRLDRTAGPPAEAAELLRALVDHCEGTGHPVQWWVSAAEPADDEIARAAGLVCDRELHQMRCPLPLDVHATVEVRPFRPGIDEGPWLEVNNAAFHWHEDQSGWDRPRLAARMAEPWFDPHGFLLHERAGRLAAFCWTKDHRSTVPPMGEIYVIAVHPDFHGLGLGRELTLAGLDHLAGRGLTVGMLYVESENDVAIGLYRSLGFEVHHHDRRYRTADPDGRDTLG